MKLMQTLTLAMLIIAPAAFAATADNLLTVRQPVAPAAASNDPILSALRNVDLEKAKQQLATWYTDAREQAGDALESARNNPELQARLATAKTKAVEAKQGVVDYLQELLAKFDNSTTPAVNPQTGAAYTPAEQKGWLDRIKDAYNYAKQNAPVAQQPAAQKGALGSLWDSLTGANTQPAPATPAQYPAQAQQGIDWNAALQKAQQWLGTQGQ